MRRGECREGKGSDAGRSRDENFKIKIFSTTRAGFCWKWLILFECPSFQRKAPGVLEGGCDYNHWTNLTFTLLPHILDPSSSLVASSASLGSSIRTNAKPEKAFRWLFWPAQVTWRALGNPDIPDSSKLVKSLLQLPASGILPQISNIHLDKRSNRWKLCQASWSKSLPSVHLAFKGPITVPVRIHLWFLIWNNKPVNWSRLGSSTKEIRELSRWEM